MMNSPDTFRMSWRQRLRWAKGFYQVFGQIRQEPGFFRCEKPQLFCLRHDDDHLPRHDLVHALHPV